MDLTALTKTLALALAADSDISAWCQAAYRRELQVYTNLDPGDPPGEAQSPFLLIYPVAKSVSLRRDEKPHDLQVEIGLVEEGKVDPPTRPNLVEFVGSERIEELRTLAQAAIAANLPGELDIEEIHSGYGVIEDWPFFYIGMALKLSESVCIGGNYLD